MCRSLSPEICVPICSQRPETRGSHQAADSVSASWGFHPSEVLSKLPPLRATVVITLKLRLDRSISPHPASSPCWVLPNTKKRMLSLSSLGEGLGASSFLALRCGNVLDDLVIWFVVEGVASHQKPVLFHLRLVASWKNPLYYLLPNEKAFCTTQSV